ncbi:lantibiotic dehydratase family protein [Flavobacterium sp. LPB0248]|uniref:lantibiotic dehydratase family protein n=1 Tax=Flavobacterium sp. LPB0248 TaxID=2614441 RepID=UPI0015A68674|nr:lantibiotic dehydratase family protein [Flavobacterium sp. LPB0248]QLC67177.1 lantibiotic dehydratase family protein [Flavobacterium sp. LPB0248]
MSEISSSALKEKRTTDMTYLSFDKYILRTPHLSFDEVKDLNISKIRDFCSLPSISEAIYLASPELHQEMLKYLQKNHEETDEKLVFSLLKYILRMGTRCTPFGLFSGCSVGKIANETNIILKKTSDYARVTRLDMNYLCSLSQKLESNKEIRKELLYYPNTSLYKIGDELRYVEYQYVNTNRKHFLMAIDCNDFINDVIKKSEKGITIKDLATFIVDPDISIDDAEDFVHELIDNQILISSISPSVTGRDYMDILREGIQSQNVKAWLNDLKDKLYELDNKKGDNLLLYQEIIDLAKSFEMKVNKKFLFQTDLNVTYIENKLDSRVIDDVQEGLRILNKLSFKKDYKKIENFKKKFLERFEQEEVPLTLALDVETGIGFGEEYEDAGSYSVSDLIDNLPISNLGSNQNLNSKTKVTQTKLDKLLLSKLMAMFRNNESVIELKDEDFQDFQDNWDEVPNTFSTIIRVYEVNDSKPLFLMSGFGGSTATYLLSRFSHIDTNIYNYIDEILSKEEQDNIITAEIVHLPEARTGNVLSRNNLRHYEIPYLAKSSLPKEQQILISDLMVSVKNGHIVLRSKANNKEVLPLLSNAHNIEADPLPIYSFLTELQTQRKREHFGFKWGDILTNEHYLPRVMYKNIIFSLAIWRVPKTELRKINNSEELNIWLKKRSIPNRVTISDLDNNLFIDFENELSCKMFLSIIKTREYLILKEYLFNEKKAFVRKENQAMSNEFVLSFHKQKL